MISAAEIVNDPNWYLHGINLDNASLSFVKTSAKALSAASFLDQRFNTEGLQNVEISLNELVTVAESIQFEAPKFVFHTAFCCSTLLARCLDLESENVALKEPEVLMSLANYQRVRHPLLSNPAQSNVIYSLVAKLLFRPFGPGQSVLVKPTNTVNNIIQPLLATHAHSKALFLHSDLESFLISILKKGEHGKRFARQIFTLFLMDSPEAQRLDSTQLLRMTDTQVAAIAWHLQWEHFLDAQKQVDSSRIKSLHCDRLLDDPSFFLKEIIEFFEFKSLQHNFEKLIEQAPLKSNAKTPDQKFTAQNRSQDYELARQKFSESLELIIPWAKQMTFRHAYQENLGNAF